MTPQDFQFWFDINNTLVNIPLGSGYAMSWIEAIGTIFGVLCVWFASQEKTINYFFGLINVTLFAIIFYQIQLYGILMLQIFFFCANIYGWYAWTRPNSTTSNALQIRWLSKSTQLTLAALSAVAIALMTFYIDSIFLFLATITINTLNLFNFNIPPPIISADAFPFWDSVMTILSLVAQILMTRKYVENWLLWIGINIISIAIYAAQGVFVLSIEYLLLLFMATNGAKAWINKAKINTSNI